MTDEKKIRGVKKCINQIVRPKIKILKWMRREGCGDCTTCETHINNRNCKCYVPMMLITMEVEI